MDCSYRAFLPYDDLLNHGLRTMTRRNADAVVKTTDSSVWVIEVADAE